MIISEIVTNIDRRLADARAELAHLQGARAALVNGGQSATAAARPATGRKARAAAPKAAAATPKAAAAAPKTAAAIPKTAAAAPTTAAPKARKPRAAQVVPVGKLTALLAGSEGMRTKELATATSGDSARILALLKEQEVAGEVRRSGSRAATRWHLITDEDRIAARAAELAARSKPKRARKN